MKFLLIAYVLSTGGNVDSYVMDSGLSYEDCMTRVLAPLQAYQVAPNLVVSSERADLVCAIDLQK